MPKISDFSETWYIFAVNHKGADCVTQVIPFTNYQLNAQLLYSSTIYMLHYAPQHVSSSTLLIIRRTNCITTASGIVTLCKQPYSMRVLTEGDDTRGCGDKIGPPDDEQRAVRNMLRSVV